MQNRGPRQGGNEVDSRDPHPDTMASRCAVRREQLGLSREEVAREAGMSVAYLNQLEKLSDDFDPGALMRLAFVLEMSSEALREGRRDAPPGQHEAALHPQLTRLSEDECWQRLGTHGIGRIAMVRESTPVILPVNFLVDGRNVVYRTKSDGAAAVVDNGYLAFEADQIDRVESRGWSVLITGTAQHLTDNSVIESLATRAGAEPWAGGKRDLWIRVCPDQVTGRVIQTPAID
jgi:transcriptional regulator with XRE-family HTH domain